MVSIESYSLTRVLGFGVNETLQNVRNWGGFSFICAELCRLEQGSHELNRAHKEALFVFPGTDKEDL